MQEIPYLQETISEIARGRETKREALCTLDRLSIDSKDGGACCTLDLIMIGGIR